MAALDGLQIERLGPLGARSSASDQRLNQRRVDDFVGQGGGALDDVLKLPDVARIFMRQEQVQGSTASRSQNRSAKYRTRCGMSRRRSRSGGNSTLIPFRR